MTVELNTDVEQGNPVNAADVGLGVDEAENDLQKPIFNKIQVQDVVKREKQKAYEKGRREAQMELEQQAQQQQTQPPVAPQGQQSLGGIPQMSHADIEKMIAEQMPQHLQNHIQQMQTKQVVDSFVSKMQAAEQKYPGLEEKLNELDYDTLSPLVQIANNMENTGDIMNELVNNPMKMGNLLTLMYAQPKLAQKAMLDLSNSIKQNQEALAQNQSVNNPLQQIKPSGNGMDKGEKSVTDYRKMFKA